MNKVLWVVVVALWFALVLIAMKMEGYGQDA